MNTRPRLHAAALLVAVVACVSCEGFPDLPIRPFDGYVQCRPESAAPFMNLDEALARVDENGDGLLTADDLMPGEATVILSVQGVHFGSGLPSQEGFSIHTSLRPYLYTAPIEVSATERWGVEVRTDCLPELIVQVGFGSDEPAGSRVAERTYALPGIFPDIPSFEIVGFGRVSGQATLTITDVQPTRASGHMSGSTGTELVALIPEKRPTGQQIVLHAFAFRDIIDAKATLNDDR